MFDFVAHTPGLGPGWSGTLPGQFPDQALYQRLLLLPAPAAGRAFSQVVPYRALQVGVQGILHEGGEQLCHPPAIAFLSVILCER